MPATIPYCCRTVGSDCVASIRPRSSGNPEYASNVGSTDATDIVDVENETGAPARSGPVVGRIGLPSLVTSCVHALL